MKIEEVAAGAGLEYKGALYQVKQMTYVTEGMAWQLDSVGAEPQHSLLIFFKESEMGNDLNTYGYVFVDQKYMLLK